MTRASSVSALWKFLRVSCILFVNYEFTAERLAGNVNFPVYLTYATLCSGQRELCTPLVRHSNRGPEFDTFSPGTEYHFARNSFFSSGWRLRAHHFSLLWKKGQVFDTSVTGYKYYWCWIGYQLPINLQHTRYMKLFAFEEGVVDLRFVFDAPTTDNSTGIRQKWKQSAHKLMTYPFT
jgi:hypothetical protein